MLLWWILVRSCQDKLVVCGREEEEEGEISLLDELFEYAIPGSGVVLIEIPFSAKRVDNGQKQMCPSVLAVQR